MTDRHWLSPVVTWRSVLVQEVDCSTCILVAMCLSLYMNERGGSAFPSVSTLAGDCSLTERAVRKHLNEHLQPQGWLRLVERGGQKGERKRANAWEATTPELGSPIGARPRNEEAAPRNENASTPERGAPQVVHGTSPRNSGSRRSIKCKCGQSFIGITAYEDHFEQGEGCEAVG